MSARAEHEPEVSASERNEVVQLLHDKGEHAKAHLAQELLPDLVFVDTPVSILKRINLRTDEIRVLAARRHSNRPATQVANVHGWGGYLDEASSTRKVAEA